MSSVCFSPDGNIIASGSEDKTLRLWSVEGRQLHSLYGHERAINAIAFSPNGDLIASCSDDSTIRVWDLNGNLVVRLQGHEQGINALAFSPNGNIIASVGNDRTCRLWRIGWQSWLEICCDRLRYHPVFTNPESIEDPEQREIAISACETCQKYVWSKEEKSM
jgi:WD40 repeat protein